MSSNRGFEVLSYYKDMGINLPKRQTASSAGYDIEAAEDTVVPSFSFGQKPTLIKTGLKAFFEHDEVLLLVNRSSNPIKKGLVLANSVGVIDADYYNNPDNEGHLMFAFYNFSNEDITIKKGDRIGQGIFTKFLVTNDDNSTGSRTGGFGSTNQ